MSSKQKIFFLNNDLNKNKLYDFFELPNFKRITLVIAFSYKTNLVFKIKIYFSIAYFFLVNLPILQRGKLNSTCKFGLG